MREKIDQMDQKYKGKFLKLRKGLENRDLMMEYSKTAKAKLTEDLLNKKEDD